MASLSVFCDEAGQQDMSAGYYLLTLVLHDQSTSLGPFDRRHDGRRVSGDDRLGGGEGVDKGYACGAVTNGMYISPTGKVLPCMTLNETVNDPMFPSILEKPLAEILSDSFYHEMSLLKMRACIEHNEKRRDCKNRLDCGAGDLSRSKKDSFAYYQRVIASNGEDLG